MAGEEAPDRAIAEGDSLVRERAAQLFDRDVGRFFDKREDRVLVRLDPSGPAVSALRSSARFAPFALERPPPADARGADPELLARLAMAQASRNRRQHPNPKIKR